MSRRSGAKTGPILIPKPLTTVSATFKSCAFNQIDELGRRSALSTGQIKRKLHKGLESGFGVGLGAPSLITVFCI